MSRAFKDPALYPPCPAGCGRWRHKDDILCEPCADQVRENDPSLYPALKKARDSQSDAKHYWKGRIEGLAMILASKPKWKTPKAQAVKKGAA